MSLYDDIVQDMTTSIKGKDTGRLAVLRGLKAAIKNKQVELRQELDDNQIRGVISSEIKKRKEAIEQFNRGSRPDLVDKEETELKILSGYLPPQLSGEEIKEILASVIEELSASGPKDLGRVMKSAMPKLAGRADGREVNQLARELLS
ncbi:MAG: GatB/YqeY domain-containing protein [Deltaproteobacteria bacterium]|nr:MAG: GatB/YqeY domain-containing protein [Deltaproteobacteria bacterium]